MTQNMNSEIEACDESKVPTNDNYEGQSADNFLSKLSIEEAERQKEEVITLSEYLNRCRNDRQTYATHSERLLSGLGEPEEINTNLSSDPREQVVYEGDIIKRYEPFKEMYDSEKQIASMISQLRSGGKKLVVGLGPVGTGKSAIGNILEQTMEKMPVYVLKCKVTKKISPFMDSPLCLISKDSTRTEASNTFNIPERYLTIQESAWVSKRIKHHKGDLNAAFEVAKIYPSRDLQIAIAKMESDDEQSPDIGALIGKTDYSQIGEVDPLDEDKILKVGDPDTIIPGLLSKSNGGMLHLSEFLRNNSTLTNKLLDPVVEGFFMGPEGVGRLPCNALVYITSNYAVWEKFLSEPKSEAFSDRAVEVEMGYTMRVSEEKKIYEKMLKSSSFSESPQAPGSLELLATFAIATRLKDGEGNVFKDYSRLVRARVMNGEDVDGSPVVVPSYALLTDPEKASKDEGLEGFSVRSAETILQNAFNARASEGIEEIDKLLILEAINDFITKNPKHTIKQGEMEIYKDVYAELKLKTEKEVKEIIFNALEDHNDATNQVQFDKYVEYANAWIDERPVKKHGEKINREKINRFLEEIEKKGGITQPEKFRQSVVDGYNAEIARKVRSNSDKPEDRQVSLKVKWDDIKPIGNAIRAQNEADMERRLYVPKAVSETALTTEEERKIYSRFHEKLKSDGYTKTMIYRMLN